jgi:hypothetical protein
MWRVYARTLVIDLRSAQGREQKTMAPDTKISGFMVISVPVSDFSPD